MQVLKTPGLRFSLLVYTMSHLSIPLSGMTGIFFYTTIYFKRAGLSEDFSQYVTIGMCLLVILSSVATLPMMDRCDLTRGLTAGALTDSLKSMQNGKSPGSDGLPAEFWKFFWADIRDDFVEVVDFIYRRGLIF